MKTYVLNILAKAWINESMIGVKPAFMALMLPFLIVFIVWIYLHQVFPLEMQLVPAKLSEFPAYHFQYGKYGESIELDRSNGERWRYEISHPNYFSIRKSITQCQNAERVTVFGSPGSTADRVIYALIDNGIPILSYRESKKYFDNDRFIFPIVLLFLIVCAIVFIPGVIISTHMYKKGKLRRSQRMYAL